MNRLVTFAAGLIIVWIIGYLLIAGRGILIPLVIAVFIWNLLNTIINGMRALPAVGKSLPFSVSLILSLVLVVILLMIVINIITNNVNDVIFASSRYQENLLRIFDKIDGYFQINTLSTFNSFFKDLNVQGILLNIYGVFTTITGSAVLITLYIMFLFVEQLYFKEKMNALFSRATHRHLVDSIISQIGRDTQTYLGIKTLLSLLTAFASWLIMKLVGLDFAEFWALLIFFLNYIPNIGAMIATAFPALLALIQFQSWGPFIIVTTGIIAIEFFIGNFIEPRFLSNSLNLSPLIIIIALSLWGLIWGILGMFLAVPITVMLMIVFAHFETTRPIAILLSQDGNVNKNFMAKK